MDGLLRDQFPILTEKRYFNTCSMGAMSYANQDAITEFSNEWNKFAGFGWNRENGWMSDVNQARENFAKLIGAKTQNIAFSFGNSVSVNAITSSFNFNVRNEVIFNELDFPSSPANFMALSEKGVKYKIATSEDGYTVSIDNYKQLISPQTQLISSCDVVSNTGFRIDRQALIELAHQNDVPVFLDAYQSIGSIDVDVMKLDVDFLASGCLKWTVGGFGISFLYVRDDWIEKLNPSAIGWYGVDNPFEDLLDKLRHQLVRPKDASKFQMGTPYPIGAKTANSGFNMILKLGVTKIEQYNHQLVDYLLEKLRDLNLNVITPQEQTQRGHIVNIQVPNAIKIVNHLTQQNYLLDMRAKGIRISLHFYNNQEDIDELIDAIANYQKLT